MFFSICEMSYVVVLGAILLLYVDAVYMVDAVYSLFFLNFKSKEMVYLTIIYSCKEYV